MSTPYQTGLLMDAWLEEQETHRKEQLFLAWHIEALARCKKLPSLENMLAGKPKALSLADQARAALAGFKKVDKRKPRPRKKNGK